MAKYNKKAKDPNEPAPARSALEIFRAENLEKIFTKKPDLKDPANEKDLKRVVKKKW